MPDVALDRPVRRLARPVRAVAFALAVLCVGVLVLVLTWTHPESSTGSARPDPSLLATGVPDGGRR